MMLYAQTKVNFHLSASTSSVVARVVDCTFTQQAVSVDIVKASVVAGVAALSLLLNTQELFPRAFISIFQC